MRGFFRFCRIVRIKYVFKKILFVIVFFFIVEFYLGGLVRTVGGGYILRVGE